MNAHEIIDRCFKAAAAVAEEHPHAPHYQVVGALERAKERVVAEIRAMEHRPAAEPEPAAEPAPEDPPASARAKAKSAKQESKGAE